MSDIFVDNIKHQSSQGSGTITLGASGEKVDLGATAGGTLTNRPAFDVTLSANYGTAEGLTNNAYNLIPFDTETWDTDSAYNNSTYRFTCPSGKDGKYFFYLGIYADPNADNQTRDAIAAIYKNGSLYRQQRARPNQSAYSRYEPIYIAQPISLSANDYVEPYFYGLDSNTGHKLIALNCFFGGYRLIGV
jgi:hypothetical protein